VVALFLNNEIVFLSVLLTKRKTHACLITKFHSHLSTLRTYCHNRLSKSIASQYFSSHIEVPQTASYHVYEYSEDIASYSYTALTEIFAEPVLRSCLPGHARSMQSFEAGYGVDVYMPQQSGQRMLAG
jgi:hypothetical protein